MAIVKTITATAERKSDDYCKRVIGLGLEVTLEEGDDPKAVLQTWTRRLQFLCDQELGDQDHSGSFRGARTPPTNTTAPPPMENNTNG